MLQPELNSIDPSLKSGTSVTAFQKAQRVTVEYVPPLRGFGTPAALRYRGVLDERSSEKQLDARDARN
jgi:hypothetical protein